MRGFTYVPHIWAISANPEFKPMKIEFDEHDKPIGPNKSDFIQFLGSIARNGKLAPLLYPKWSDMPKEEKQAILTHVKGTFAVPVGYEERILQAVGKSWKCYKARIKAKYYSEELTLEGNLRNRPDTCDEKGCDERINVEHWKFLVNHCSSKEAKETSNRNKRNRAQKKMQHTTGKRSFAQHYDLEREAIDKLVETLAEDDVHYDPDDFDLSRATFFEKCYSKDGNTSNPHVADALVLGEEKGTRIRTYGTTKSSRIYGAKEVSSDTERITEENEEMKKRMEEQQKLIQKLLRKDEMNGDSSTPPRHNSKHAQLHEVSNSSSTLKVGVRVILKSMVVCTKSVAKGYVESINPSKSVGTEELGDGWCEVRVIVAIEHEEQLIRSIGSVKQVGHAIGSNIAWPKHLVVVEQAR